MGSIVPILQPVRMVENDYIFQRDDHPYDRKTRVATLQYSFW